MNAATIAQGHNLIAKVNESLVYSKSYGKMELFSNNEIYTYQNGYPNQPLLLSNGTLYGTNEFYLLVNISTYQGNEAGEYFVIVYTNLFTLLTEYGCSHYFYFVFSLRSSIVWNVETLQIQTTGNTFLYTITHVFMHVLCLWVSLYNACPHTIICYVYIITAFLFPHSIRTSLFIAATFLGQTKTLQQRED